MSNKNNNTPCTASRCNRCDVKLSTAEAEYCFACEKELMIQEVTQEYNTKDGARSLVMLYD